MNRVLEEMRSALWGVWSRRWLALAVAWGACVLGWLALALVPNTYESQARVFVQLDDVLAEQIGIGVGSREKDIERIRQTLTSAVNLERVIRSTRLGEGIASREEMDRAIRKLAEDIKVVGDERHVFEIAARSGRRALTDAENAQLAQDIAQRLVDIFREANLGATRGEMRDTIDFLDRQLAERQRELEAAEERRLAFEAEHPDLIGGAQAISNQLAATRSELRGVEADLAAAQSALAALDGQLAGTPRTLITPESGGPRAALAQAEADLAALQGRGLTESHPDVIALQRQIAVLRRQAQGVNGDATGTPNPAWTSLQSMRVERQAAVQALQSRAAALRAELATIAAAQAEEPAAAAEAQRISRDYEVLRRQYDELLKDREELRLRGQVETEHNAVRFEVVDPPTTPRVPVSPNRPLLLLGVLIAGLGAGAGSAYALGRIKGTFATATSLESTFDLPVIGTISHRVAEAARPLVQRRTTQFALAASTLGMLFVVLIGIELVQRVAVA